MKQIQKLKHRMRERGNVLFLILIAVALFAALSYAVTSSSRTSSGTTDGESNLINSAQITQYPASVRTAVVRMLINGVAADQLEFNGPTTFDDLTDTNPGAAVTYGWGVFHPDGGGATLVTAPPEVMENVQPGVWRFNSAYQVTNIGTTIAGSSAANDVLAFLPGVQKAACRRLNQELGINESTTGWDDTDGDTIPTANIAWAQRPHQQNNMGGAVTGQFTPGIGAGATSNFTIAGAFSGQAYGCFDADPSTATQDDQFVYYHVLLDR
ncbi:MAG: hypothetical protein LRZ85_05885 [Alphaproteobacteria bacterium]|nr:hypothetical protein [Alphaproteobacteria bacterium]MCD8519852.1 hypothetical protein [Alphaproteobacteria bacterium]MCD8571034.1 hypothetical protein [Alphaproteobacteria bacterium]